MKCEDKKLIEKSAQFFEGKTDLKEVFVTEDGQYFYTEQASTFHCQQRAVKVMSITRDMALGAQKAPAPIPEVIEPKAETPIEETPVEETPVEETPKTEQPRKRPKRTKPKKR